MSENTKNITVAYIGGGSMNFGWRFIGELCQEECFSGTVRLFDNDKKLALANEVIANKTRELPDSKTQMIFIAVDTLEEALRDADFVIISVSAGTAEEHITDIQLPELYGIYQAAGDNSGPGGIIRALRTIPLYINYAEKIRELCPEAWVVSLSEPMSACIKTLYKAFPKIKAFGCSNDIFQTQELFTDFLSENTGAFSLSRREIKTNILGINKFCWISEALYNGESLFDIYADNARKYADDGYEKKKLDYKSNPFACAHKVKFDLLLRYGLIAASSDRYLADSCPPWYLSSPRNASSWKLGMMSPAYIKKRRADRIAKCRKLINGDEFLRIGYSGTECISQIKAISGMNNLITNAITINTGQITNISQGSAVETNALFSKNSVRPVFAGLVPEDISALLNRQVQNTDMLVDAIFARDLDSVFNVFLNDPLVTLDLNRSAELYKQLLSVNKAHMIYYC
ncbi:MAG: alpha-glucosidase/alpha-galactosidase [Oscillospiraceae bacterium]|jgi:alpha-galactosidase